MDLDLNTIINALVAIIGAGGVYGGAKYGYNRYMAARSEAEARTLAEAGFSPINTGKFQALDVVTGTECSNTQRRITDSIHEVRNEVKSILDRNSEQLSRMSESIGEMKTALASQEAAIIKSVGFGIREHENRFHRSRLGTGDYPKR